MSLQPEQGLRARLIADAAVRAIIGVRCYPMKAPQTAPRPYLVYRRIAGNPERHMLGASELAQARIQIDCLADSYASARGLGDAVRLALDGFKGEIAVGDGTFYVRHLSLENDSDDFTDPTLGSDDGVYTVSHDYLIFYILPPTIFT